MLFVSWLHIHRIAIHYCRAVVLKRFGFAAYCKTYKYFLARFVYKIRNVSIYFKLGIKIKIMFVIILYTNWFLLIFKIYIATSCGAPFENHCCRVYSRLSVITKGKRRTNNRQTMDNPSFGCDRETMLIAEHRNSKMYVQLPTCSIISKIPRLMDKVYWT
jgi:hypothetical protein